jgi:hypothetical protein
MSLDKSILDSLEQQSKAPRCGSEIKSPFELLGSLIGKLTKRVEELERRPHVKYLGVHKPGATYSEGSLVTRDGSIFHCNKTTTALPGDGSQDWTLACKRGKDGKDPA